MKCVIRFSARAELKALPILLRHSLGMVLPDRAYIISVEAASALRDAGITFTELCREYEARSAEATAFDVRI
jgi:hypothetical protein